MLFQIKASLGLKKADDISGPNIGFVLISFEIAQKTFITFRRQFGDALLDLRIRSRLDEGSSAIGVERPANWVEHAVKNSSRRIFHIKNLPRERAKSKAI